MRNQWVAKARHHTRGAGTGFQREAIASNKVESFMMNHSPSQSVLFLAFSIMIAVGSIARPALVVIDPGHGGRDRGGIPGQQLAEKVLTLDTARRLAKILRANGNIEVVMTRDDDRFV